jgi:C4-dicarboxylate-specific signal transduction histidine kinase
MAFVALAAAAAWWLHRLDVLHAVAKPFLRERRERRIADRTRDLQRKAWDLSIHRDERDLDARLHDSLRRPATDWSDDPPMALPGVEALPDPPEAKR